MSLFSSANKEVLTGPLNLNNPVVTQVLGMSLSAGASASISGIAGIGHILTGVGIILLLVSLKGLEQDRG